MAAVCIPEVLVKLLSVGKLCWKWPPEIFLYLSVWVSVFGIGMRNCAWN